MDKKCILITGGARSGKSHFAQELALRLGGSVLFVATAVAGDEEMRARIERHRKARPKAWRTLEVTMHIGNQITEKVGEVRVVVLDCITLLVNNVFGHNDEQIDASVIEERVISEISGLVECIDQLDAGFIIVTNEVGLGLVSANMVGRLYRDLLGKANQILAQRADEVYLMIAGLPLRIKPTKYL